ncbi:shikimate dehydrogenase [Actinoallomurus purpureus]|uniref:shikimate dehydrogenase n=1 Tax=Actinoallomurus purpureus TaxID=478114 RepID=UPI002093E5CC|nr:shikimate dehydrogenase [Actinoallomurus purpureus]MCO6011363.1 shikimate dehydrogenase [Actinoallomurus purpureus]
MTQAAVLGSPIAHSLSPALHRAAYAALGLDWTYEAIECREQDLPGVLEGPWAGLSLTMPLKRAVIPLLDDVSALARAVGGANTVVYDGGRRLGANTDVYGMVTALTEAGVRSPGSAVVLGGGATACSALAALRDLGLPKVVVVVRTPARAAEAVSAADRLGVSVSVQTLADTMPPADLIISTLPAHAADPYAEAIARATGALFDVVYAPWPTAAGKAVGDRGGIVVGGLPMLVHQAARQVELMTGRAPAPVEAMRAAVS